MLSTRGVFQSELQPLMSSILIESIQPGAFRLPFRVQVKRIVQVKSHPLQSSQQAALIPKPYAPDST